MQARISDITRLMEKLFPVSLAEAWDNPGLQIGSLSAPATRVLVALDLDREVLDYARAQKADMIITHHPLIFKGLRTINLDTAMGAVVKELIEAGITVYSAHTNLDAGEKGLSQFLAEKLGLLEIKPLDSGRQENLFKLVVYVPAEQEAQVRQALLDNGAGHIGKYSDCSFRTRGIGTFRPLAGASPFIGQAGMLEETEEFRLETIIPSGVVPQALQSMLDAHPYEEVAYDLYALSNPGRVYSLGREGRLESAMSLADFCNQVKQHLGVAYLRVAGDLNKIAQKVAVVGGSGASFIDRAYARGCQVLVTGDLKYHEARQALDLGLAVIDAGHQGTEQIVCEYLCGLLAEEAGLEGLEAEFVYRLAPECIKII